MHPIEQELREAAAYKVERKFNNRQDFLKSILNAVYKISEEDFDQLTDNAADWFNAAVKAVNGQDDIPDFDDEVESEEDEPDAEESEGADPETGEILEDTGTYSDDDGTDDDPTEDEDEPSAEPEQPAPSKAKKVKKEPVRRFNKAGKRIPNKQPRPPKTVEVQHKPDPYQPPKRGKLTPGHQDVEVDKWGCMVGSKNSRALEMFEAGSSAAEVKAELKGTYYNILKKLVQNGHKLERTGNILKITHKDDLNKAAKTKKK